MENSFLQLKHVREELGLSLNDVAQKLSIQRNYLENIESGQWNELPEDVYAVGFIRNYAKFLNVKSDDIVKQFKMSRSTAPNSDAHVTDLPNNMKFVFDKQVKHWTDKIMRDKNLQLLVAVVGVGLLAVVSYLSTLSR